MKARKARLVRIGGRLGVHLPESLIAQAGLSGEVELRASAGRIVISNVTRPRAGWAEAAAAISARGDDLILLDFDETSLH